MDRRTSIFIQDTVSEYYKFKNNSKIVTPF